MSNFVISQSSKHSLRIPNPSYTRIWELLVATWNVKGAPNLPDDPLQKSWVTQDFSGGSSPYKLQLRFPVPPKKKKFEQLWCILLLQLQLRLPLPLHLDIHGTALGQQSLLSPDARYGEVSNNNPYDLKLAASLIDANSSVASQSNYTHHGVSALAFPILQNSPATALRKNSFYYPEPPHNVEPSRPEAESTDSDPVAYWTAGLSSYNSESEGSYDAFPPGPAELPFDKRLSAHLVPLHYYEASNGNAFAFAQKSTNASSAVSSQYSDYTNGSVTPSQPGRIATSSRSMIRFTHTPILPTRRYPSLATDHTQDRINRFGFSYFLHLKPRLFAEFIRCVSILTGSRGNTFRRQRLYYLTRAHRSLSWTIPPITVLRSRHHPRLLPRKRS
ncbi:hypothetical protein J3R82DRAFT_1984 [Butyriboletus roseoflavus]|nr:hypothetical protein J3R82DRAFT_1984 [Butyriboletus roseoflavus]